MVIRNVAIKVSGMENGTTPAASCSYMTPELFDTLRNAAGAESVRIAVPVSFAIADKAGVLQYFCRDPKAIQVSCGVAQNKAYTAAVMKCPSGALAEACGPNGSLFGLNTADPRIVVFGGGFPLKVNGETIGAIGVSGGSVDEDVAVCNAVLRAYDEYIAKIGK
jgi:uncharacterized protein GlcG (DUF336 family)